MSLQASMSGARLSYVVRKLEGTVKREQVRFEEVPAGKHRDGSPRVVHQMKRETVEVPAGYIVYFPRGHVLRLSEAQVKQYQLDKKPKMINLQGLNDPNSPIGMLLMQQDEESRSAAYTELEKMVIQIATVKSGPIQLPEQLEQAKARVRRVRGEAEAA